METKGKSRIDPLWGKFPNLKKGEIYGRSGEIQWLLTLSQKEEVWSEILMWGTYTHGVQVVTTQEKYKTLRLLWTLKDDSEVIWHDIVEYY